MLQNRSLSMVKQKVKVKEAQLCQILCNPKFLQSMEFSRSEYQSQQPFLSPGDLPHPGIEPTSPTLQADSLPAEPQGKPKERPCQRMFKLLHNCTHLTRQQSNAQNYPSEASTVHEARTFRDSSWIQKRQRNQRLNCQHPLDHQTSKRGSEKHLLLLY